MEWITKIISTLKIPLKVLLPAVCLFSGLLLFLNDEILIKLNLLEWKNKNGFVFGLIFLISTTLIVIYIFNFLKLKISQILCKLTINRKTIRTINKFSEKEIAIIMQMYFSDGYTMNIDYADPVVKSLIARKYIYLGNNAQVLPDLYDHLWTKGTLQPFVWQALQWLHLQNEKEIKKLEKKIGKEKNKDKLDLLNQELDKCYKIRDNSRRN